MKTKVLYRRARVTVEFDRPKKCEVCAKAGRTELHHYEYAYETKLVRKYPELALDNTVSLCFQCHRIADMFRKLKADPARAAAVLLKIENKTYGLVD